MAKPDKPRETRSVEGEGLKMKMHLKMEKAISMVQWSIKLFNFIGSFLCRVYGNLLLCDLTRILCFFNEPVDVATQNERIASTFLVIFSPKFRKR